MAFLDVSDGFDTDFWDTISVIRRAESISDKGRSVITPVTTNGVSAVVTPMSGSDLERIPNYDIAKKYVSVITNFRLQLNSLGYKNDQVIWGDTTFEVITLDDCSRFGQGFVEAICASIQYQDAPPTPQ